PSMTPVSGTFDNVLLIDQVPKFPIAFGSIRSRKNSSGAKLRTTIVREPSSIGAGIVRAAAIVHRNGNGAHVIVRNAAHDVGPAATADARRYARRYRSRSCRRRRFPGAARFAALLR